MLVNLAALVLGFIVLLLLEYQTHIKSPSLWQSIKPSLVIYTVPSIGVVLAGIFEPAFASFVAVLWLFALLIFTAVSRLSIKGGYKAYINTSIFFVFLVCSFIVSPLYVCPQESRWYILGKDATLITQENGQNRLCHESTNDQSQTECHDFIGGYHGLFATPVD